jgi:cytochrome P450
MGVPEPADAGRHAEAEAAISCLTTPEAIADPYPVYSRLRALSPVHRSGPGLVFLSGYDECAAVTRSPDYRSQSPEWADRALPGWRDRPSKVTTFETMLFRDPPDHTRLRRLVSGAFTARRVEGMRDDVAALCQRAVDAIADAGAGGAAVNLAEILALSLPVSVIGALVGVPQADWAPLQQSMSALMRVVELSVSKQDLDAADQAAVALREYFAGLVAERRRSGRDDLTSALAAVRDRGGSALTEDELLQTLTFMFMAGVDTMVNLLLNGTAALLDHPDQADLLRAEPGRGAAAVDEVLRYDAPVQLVGRVAAVPAAIGGVALPADCLVIAMLGAANRDPARFREPDSFDITRTGTTVLSFGGGLHYCLGAPLARLEAGTFLPALVRRFPRLRLAGTPARAGVVFRGFSRLPVAVR